MTVGLVVVSHSDLLARGIGELATQMAPHAVIATAGGTEDGGLGTSLERTLAALADADDGSGVVVLYDLGSAEMIAQAALELLGDDQRARVRISEAPLVSGALAAATAAQGGASLDEVVTASGTAGQPSTDTSTSARGPADAEVEVALRNPLGLHARPAAHIVAGLRDIDADVHVEHVETGSSTSARSLLGLVGLAAAGGATLRLRAWGEEADEAVATIAALVADGFGEHEEDAVRPPRTAAASPQAADAEPGELVGTGVAGGLALGRAVRLDAGLPEVPDEPVADPPHERRRLEAARRAARRELETLSRGAGGDILRAQALLLDDPQLDEEVTARLEAGAAAAAAWRAAVETQQRRLAELPGEVFAARAGDVADVGRRVLGHLLDPDAQPHEAPSVDGRIVVADDLVPSQIADLWESGAAGIALARGAATSHSAILARNLDLPLVLGVGETVRGITDGTVLLIDGSEGSLLIDPSPHRRTNAKQRLRAAATTRAAMLAAAHTAGRLADDTPVVVRANASTAVEARAAREHGADGIGLVRTEVAFFNRSDVPTEEEQAAALAAVVAEAGDELVVVRTLDVGGDKPIPALNLDPVANGFLGVRGLRHSLAHPTLFHTQLRAILRAAAGHRVAVMFPMVTHRNEVRAAKAALAAARESLAAEDRPHGEPEAVGVMVEVPAAALAADELAAEVDFLSIGSNDLTQYVMAADRTLVDVAAFYKPASPPLLRLIADVCHAADAAGRRVAVCGEMAGDPDLAVILVGLGVRELSMAASAIPSVKRRLREVTLADAQADACRRYDATSHPARADPPLDSLR